MEEDIVYLKKIIEYFKVGIKIEFGNKDIEKLENLIKGYREKEESEKYLYEAYQDAGKKMFDYAEELEQLKRDFEIVDQECSRLEKEDIRKDKIVNEIDRFKTFMVNMINKTSRDSIDKNKVIEMFMEIDNILKGK